MLIMDTSRDDGSEQSEEAPNLSLKGPLREQVG